MNWKSLIPSTAAAVCLVARISTPTDTASHSAATAAVALTGARKANIQRTSARFFARITLAAAFASPPSATASAGGGAACPLPLLLAAGGAESG